MLGAAAVGDFGPVTAKLRAAYGKGIRPVSSLGRTQYGQTISGSMNPTSLGAERQAGTEVGLDLLVRRAWSFKVTRFDQRASGLFQQVAIPADSTYMSRRMTYALENVGEISNRVGPEAGTVSRLSVSSTLSFVNSRVSSWQRLQRRLDDRRQDACAFEHGQPESVGWKPLVCITGRSARSTGLTTTSCAHEGVPGQNRSARPAWRSSPAVLATYNGGLRLRALHRAISGNALHQLSAENSTTMG
jgi:hypothetical protein